MVKIVDFLKQNLKFIILFVVILIIVLILLLSGNSRKGNLSINENIKLLYFCMYSTDGKVGVIDRSGKEIIEPIYVDIYIPNPEKDVFFCFLAEDDCVILNSKKEEIFKNYENLEALRTSETDVDFEKFVLKYESSGKCGLINFQGEIVVEAGYDNIQSLKNKPGEFLVKKDNKYGVLGADGKIKVDIKYDSIIADEFFNEKDRYSKVGYIVGEKTSAGYIYGYLNSSGKEVLKRSFESITRVQKNDNNYYLIVMNNGKKGVYKNENEIIKQSYQSIMYAEGLDVFIVKRNSKYGVFSSSGKEILSVKYESCSLAGDYIQIQEFDGGKKLYDVNGNEVANSGYVNIQAVKGQNCYIAVDSKGFYSIVGREDTIFDNYTYISYAFDNYFIFRNEAGYYGLLGLYEGVVIEPEYSLMITIEGKKIIEAEMQDGTIDIYSKDLEKRISMSNAIVESIDDNYIRIYSNTEMRYINKDGKEVKNAEVYPNHKLYAYLEDGKWGFKNSKEEKVVLNEYDFVTEINEYGFAGVLKDNKWGIVNEKGDMVLEAVIELETYYLPNFIGKYLLEITDNSKFCRELE